MTPHRTPTFRTHSVGTAKPGSKSVVGIGLLARDVVIHGKAAPTSHAGGSCANVLALLTWLGWDASPIARIGDDPAGLFIRNELERLGVSWNHVQHSGSLSTPTIIQEFVKSESGQVRHRFRIACPTCRQYLPRFVPPTMSITRTALESLPVIPKCLYIDRISPSAAFAARWISERGGMVVVEPPSLNDPKLFKQVTSVATVLKYSCDHAEKLRPALQHAKVPLEIETLGERGLRYRTFKLMRHSAWKTLEAFPVTKFIDAAGAGDACTAALIDSMTIDGVDAFNNPRHLEQCLDGAQAFASINCSYIGARGVMNAMTAKVALGLASKLRRTKHAPTLPRNRRVKTFSKAIVRCDSCATRF